MKLKKQCSPNTDPQWRINSHFGGKIQKNHPPYAPALCVLTGWSIWGPAQQSLFPEDLVILSSGDKRNILFVLILFTCKKLQRTFGLLSKRHLRQSLHKFSALALSFFPQVQGVTGELTSFTQSHQLITRMWEGNVEGDVLIFFFLVQYFIWSSSASTHSYICTDTPYFLWLSDLKVTWHLFLVLRGRPLGSSGISHLCDRHFPADTHWHAVWFCLPGPGESYSAAEWQPCP